MDFYPRNITLHILIAGIWLSYFVVELLLKNRIKKEDDSTLKKVLIIQYLKFTNLFVLTGSIGIILTGVFLVVNNSHYGFFNMANNHWLATKQILFVIILINIFVNILPTIKKITLILKNSDSKEALDKSLKKLFKANFLINILVLLNFLFAITHKFYS